MTVPDVSGNVHRLPEALLTDFSWQAELAEGSGVTLVVPDSYEALLQAAPAASEVLGIQRLISLTRRYRVQAIWEENAAARAQANPHSFPLLSVLMLLRHVDQFISTDGGLRPYDVEQTRKVIRAHRLVSGAPRADLAVCVEGEAQSLSPALYDQSTLKLLPRESFETLAVDLYSSQLEEGKTARDVYTSASLLGTILAELIENSDVHGRFDLGGRLVGQSAVRGVMFRRLDVELPVKNVAIGEPKTGMVKCFEASVFDSGVGYYCSYTREPLSPATDIRTEWMVLHKCLERHFYPELPDQRPAHRGLGLYEVLRALQALKGRIEFRTGRVFAYRTFMDGELQAAMKPRASLARLAWPEPRLLDVKKKYLSVPTTQEPLEGASVRILVPLS